MLLANVIPLLFAILSVSPLPFGKGDTESMANKRGITLASNIGKLFERILNNRLIATLKFTEGQAGGRKERSTVDQLYLLKSIIEQANRSKKKLYITFIDIEKAYDKTWLDAAGFQWQ